MKTLFASLAAILLATPCYADTVDVQEYLRSCYNTGDAMDTAACMGYTLGAVDSVMFSAVENGRPECLAAIKQVPNSIIVQYSVEYMASQPTLHHVNAASIIRGVIMDNWCP